MAVGKRSVYTVLGSRLRDAKRKKEEAQKAQEVVADDWEEEVRKDEERDEENSSRGPRAVDSNIETSADETSLPGNIKGKVEEQGFMATISDSLSPVPPTGAIS